MNRFQINKANDNTVIPFCDESKINQDVNNINWYLKYLNFQTIQLNAIKYSHIAKQELQNRENHNITSEATMRKKVDSLFWHGILGYSSVGKHFNLIGEKTSNENEQRADFIIGHFHSGDDATKIKNFPVKSVVEIEDSNYNFDITDEKDGVIQAFNYAPLYYYNGQIPRFIVATNFILFRIYYQDILHAETINLTKLNNPKVLKKLLLLFSAKTFLNNQIDKYITNQNDIDIIHIEQKENPKNELIKQIKDKLKQAKHSYISISDYLDYLYKISQDKQLKYNGEDFNNIYIELHSTNDLISNLKNNKAIEKKYYANQKNQEFYPHKPLPNKPRRPFKPKKSTYSALQASTYKSDMNAYTYNLYIYHQQMEIYRTDKRNAKQQKRQQKHIYKKIRNNANKILRHINSKITKLRGIEAINPNAVVFINKPTNRIRKVTKSMLTHLTNLVISSIRTKSK